MTSPQDATLTALATLKELKLQDPYGRLDAVMFWREFVKAGGLQLDPILWNLENDAAAVMSGMVETALSNGWDSSKAAAHFLYDSGVSGDVMRADINHEIDEYTSFGDLIDEFFMREINRAYLGVSVVQECADLSELTALDQPAKNL